MAPTTSGWIVDDWQEYTWHTWTSTETVSNQTAATYNAATSTTRTWGTNVDLQIWYQWNAAMRNPVQTDEDRARREYWHASQRQERIARRRRAEAHHQQEVAERAVRMREADNKARELLCMVLSEAEHEHYAETGEILFTGSEGNRYRINQARNVDGNIEQVNDDGLMILRLCAHPHMWRREGQLPLADAWVAQILALKTSEEDFRRIANVQWQRYDTPVAA